MTINRMSSPRGADDRSAKTIESERNESMSFEKANNIRYVSRTILAALILSASAVALASVDPGVGDRASSLLASPSAGREVAVAAAPAGLIARDVINGSFRCFANLDPVYEALYDAEELFEMGWSAARVYSKLALALDGSTLLLFNSESDALLCEPGMRLEIWARSFGPDSAIRDWLALVSSKSAEPYWVEVGSFVARLSAESFAAIDSDSD